VYWQVLRVPDARRVLLLGLLIRAPLWASAIILTLHVVSTLDHSYAAAGLVTTCSTLGLAISAPWRGRMLDRRGLRRTVLPQLMILAVVWSIAPWVGYWLLLPLVFIGGLFVVPTFSIVRQVLISAVEDRLRTAALSLEAMVTEMTFMVGPILGVLGSTYLGTRWALFAAEMLTVVGGALIWVLNPRLVREGEEEGEPVARRTWLTSVVVAVLAASATITVIFTGADLGVVAALRSMGHPGSIGWVLGAWGLGSAMGAIAYGAMHRRVSVFVLLALLGLSTLPMAFAPNRFWLAVLLLVSGLFAAPTVVATVERLARAVPARARGEAMGWHGSALMLGGALGAPLGGVAIDRGGWESAFVVCAAIGVVVGLCGHAVSVSRRAVSTGRVAAE
jgi:predicted MFS family arabinose efflux permease